MSLLQVTVIVTFPHNRAKKAYFAMQKCALLRKLWKYILTLFPVLQFISACKWLYLGMLRFMLHFISLNMFFLAYSLHLYKSTEADC